MGQVGGQRGARATIEPPETALDQFFGSRFVRSAILGRDR
jgi:hypothetical protein